jgi:hypothetical protein
MISTGDAATGVRARNTRVASSSLLGRAPRMVQDGGLASWKSQMVCVTSLRLSSMATWRGSISIGRRGFVGLVVAAVPLTGVTTMAQGRNRVHATFAGQRNDAFLCKYNAQLAVAGWANPCPTAFTTRRLPLVWASGYQRDQTRAPTMLFLQRV